MEENFLRFCVMTSVAVGEFKCININVEGFQHELSMCKKCQILELY
jgi:hypothetical protein